MVDKTLINAEEGDFDTLRQNAVDPSDIEENKWIKNANGDDTTTPNPRFGKPKFLSWTLTKDEEGKKMWEAKGKDGKIYRIKDDNPKPIDKGKVEIV